MQYIGNKQSLVPTIYELMQKHDVSGEIFLDLFAGTHSVGSFFKNKGYTVYANDWQAYSFYLGKAIIENTEYPEFNKLINSEELQDFKEQYDDLDNYNVVLNYLNDLEGIEGFFYNNYCPTGTINQEYQKLYFTDENGKKFDSIRTKIEEWKESRLIKENEYYILVSTAMEAMDKVSNTTSVYGAFLKQFKRASLKDIVLKPLDLNLNGSNHKVYQEDANELVKKIDADIVYLDPPYNSRQYALNYHVLETMALYDNPTLYGKTGTRNYDHQKSDFSSKLRITDAFETLIKNISETKAKYIVLSYNNEGLLSDEYILSILNKYGEVIKEEIDYKRYRSDSDNNKRKYKKTNKVIEYVYIVKR